MRAATINLHCTGGSRCPPVQIKGIENRRFASTLRARGWPRAGGGRVQMVGIRPQRPPPETCPSMPTRAQPAALSPRPCSSAPQTAAPPPCRGSCSSATKADRLCSSCRNRRGRLKESARCKERQTDFRGASNPLGSPTAPRNGGTRGTNYENEDPVL